MNAALQLPVASPSRRPPTATLPIPPSVAERSIADIKTWCLDRADEWHARGELGAARDFLNHAAAVDPDDAQVWLALGSLQYELGCFEAAGLAFHMADGLKPLDARVFLHLGLVHQKLKHPTEVEVLFAHAVALAPDNALARGILGGWLLENGRYTDARPHFEHALVVQPNNVENLLRLGVCCFKTGDFAGARRCYEHVLQLIPGHALAKENLIALKKFCAAAACLK